MQKQILEICFLGIILAACNSSGKKSGNSNSVSHSESDVVVHVDPEVKNTFGSVADTLSDFYFNPESLVKIDFDQDLSKKTLPELVLLRNLIFARNGQLMHEDYLRNYYSSHYKWYDSITTLIFMRKLDKIEETPEISKEERRFTDKIDKLIEEKKKENYSGKTPDRQANVNNIVNQVSFRNISPEFLEKLKKNQYVIAQSYFPQLFNVYENNAYDAISSFITTDLYLQLFHQYFVFVQKTIEKERLISYLEQIALGMYRSSKKIAESSTNDKIKQLAEYNQVFYAIPYKLLSLKDLPIPAKYNGQYKKELDCIKNEKGDYDGSEFLDIKYFPYSLFKPRGYYTREDSLKRYFKAIMWMQTACFCKDNTQQVRNATFAAFILNTEKAPEGKYIMDKYEALYKTISFLVGEPDDLSIFDIATLLKKENVKDISKITDDGFINHITEKLSETIKGKNKIVPKIKFTCSEKINFMPRRYVFDNEILLQMADSVKNAKRAFPRGIDVFAALGNKTSNDLLYNYYKDDKKWDWFTSYLDGSKKKMSNFDSWDASVYNKWFECLKNLSAQGKSKIELTNTNAWEKKSLNTALASWSELKHDAILYAKQPSAAEYGDGGEITPPASVIKGYVEPNIEFWGKMLELLDLTEKLLDKYNYNFDKIKGKTQKIREHLEFVSKISKKEINKEKVTDEEYGFITSIGGEIDNLTLNIVMEHADGWFDVTTPDTCVSVIADVYLRNVTDCPKNGVLYEAVGRVNNLFVVVEIDGYLYLTKGAAFSYYEFTDPSEDRFTDEDWIKKLYSGKTPEVQEWFKEFYMPSAKIPLMNEKNRYSLRYDLMGELGIP